MGGSLWAKEAALKREWWGCPACGGNGRRDCMGEGWLCGGKRCWRGEGGAGLPWAAIACNCKDKIREGYSFDKKCTMWCNRINIGKRILCGRSLSVF